MRVIILGINGATGQAIASECSRLGWNVVGSGRDVRRFPASLRQRGVHFVGSDRYDPAQLNVLLGAGADVVVDCLCYTAQHAGQLLERREAFGSAVVLSSKAVYVDDHGRHANSEDPPHFDRPVTEDQPVLEPDFSGAFASRDGYGPNKVAAEFTLRASGAPVSILRPSLIHGRGSSRPREWFVVKRLLDGRERIALAHGGRTANHPTAAVNLARLVTTCAQHPGVRVINAADPDHPTAADITAAIAAACRRPVQIVGLDDRAPAGAGWTPWASWPPVFLDTTAATELGYRPAGTYADTVGDAVRELVDRADRARGGEGYDGMDGWFDYGSDDAALAYHDRSLHRAAAG